LSPYFIVKPYYTGKLTRLKNCELICPMIKNKKIPLAFLFVLCKIYLKGGEMAKKKAVKKVAKKKKAAPKKKKGCCCK